MPAEQQDRPELPPVVGTILLPRHHHPWGAETIETVRREMSDLEGFLTDLDAIQTDDPALRALIDWERRVTTWSLHERMDAIAAQLKATRGES